MNATVAIGEIIADALVQPVKRMRDTYRLTFASTPDGPGYTIMHCSVIGHKASFRTRGIRYDGYITDHGPASENHYYIEIQVS